MRVPLSWLKEYVDLPADPASLVERLTLAGLESAGVSTFGVPVTTGVQVKPENRTPVWDREKVVVGLVTKIEKHPDADKLKLVTLDYGAGEPKTVVTGAPNIAPGQSGMLVILGLRGTNYFYLDKEGKKTVFTLEPKALRGVMNDAMCMSNFELGIAEDHDGIILLDDGDAEPGTPAQDLLGEIVLELDVLPNMARCLAMLGVAREVAALTGATVREPVPTYPTIADKASDKVTVAINDAKLCARYTATVLRNITVGPAPRWLRTRLQYAGMRPISNVVDITNYVMLETGQPQHAFDYDVLVTRAGGNTPAITVRAATTGEKLKTLDGQERTLTPENLLICDAAGPIALAGVMGGAETEVTSATTTVLLESATFDFVSVRRTARQFNLFSEASTRFSRGVPAELALVAARRAAELFHKHAGGEVLSGIVDAYPTPQMPQVIELNRSEIERLLGIHVPDAEVERVLSALQFKLEPTLWGWTVTAPSSRLDLQAGAADLIEELARVSGYDRLPATLLAQEMPAPLGNRSLELEEQVRDRLADAGLSEAITYSMTSVEVETRLESASAFVALKNPNSPERAVLRKHLLPGLVEVARRNLEATDRVTLFEIGPVFLPNGDALPHEPRRLAVVMVGRRTLTAWDDPVGTTPANFDFFDLKGVLSALAGDMHLPEISVRTIKTVPYLHPGRSAELLLSGTAIGHFGELHPTIAASFDLGEKAVQVAELDLDAMLAAVPERSAYKPFSTYPPAKRDIAIVVPSDTPAEAVLAEVRTAGGDLLSTATLFDVYTGGNLPPGTKSLAFALTYQAADRTLKDVEIDKAHQKIEGRLRHVLKAQVRGKDV